MIEEEKRHALPPLSAARTFYKGVQGSSTTTSGKRPPSAVVSLASEGGDTDSAIRNATGKVMRWSVQMDGKEALALVDTGLEVTTVSQAYFDQIKDHFTLHPKPACSRRIPRIYPTVATSLLTS